MNLFCNSGDFYRVRYFVLAITAITAIPLVLAGCAPTGQVVDRSSQNASGASARNTLGSVVSSSQRSTDERTVEVMASGATRSQARDEAIRTALQSTVSQLVITDRLVQDSQVVRDDIFSTQNGFITAFEILNESRTEFGEYELRARVTVSERTILNYVALRQGPDSVVDGASLFAEVRRGVGQRSVLYEMFRRFAKGYPWDVVSLEMQSIRPFQGRSDLVVARTKAVSDSGYFVAMQEFLRQVERASYKTYYRFNRYGFYEPQVQGSIRSAVREERMLQRGDEWHSYLKTHTEHQVCMVPRPRPRPGESRSRGEIRTYVNHEGRSAGRCYVFPPGSYLHFFSGWNGIELWRDSDVGNGDSVVFIVAFLDGNGRSAIRPGSPNRVGECMLVTRGGDFPQPGFHEIIAENGGPEWGLPFRSNFRVMVFSDMDAYFNMVFRTSEVDFDRVTAFRGRPLIRVRHPNGRFNQFLYMSDIAGPPVRPEQLCRQLLDEPG